MEGNRNDENAFSLTNYLVYIIINNIIYIILNISRRFFLYLESSYF